MFIPRSSNKDIIVPVACRSVIASGYEILSVCFTIISLELSNESGELDVSGRSSRMKLLFLESIQTLHQQLVNLHTGKQLMHGALNGDHHDSELLARLGEHIEEVNARLIQPLNALYQQNSPSDVGRSHELGKELAKILEEATKDGARAEQRFAEKLEISIPEEMKDYSVICLDMAEYSKVARGREAMGDAMAVYELNRTIKKRVRAAIEEAIEKTAGHGPEFPINDRGDGAVVYIPESPEVAVKIAIYFQKDSLRRQRTFAQGTEPWKFRIGLTSGSVCLSMIRSPAQRLVEFSAGGTTIINAARFEQKCPGDCVLIDDSTYRLLSAGLKKQFSEISGGVPLKGHEGPNIKAWIWDPETSTSEI